MASKTDGSVKVTVSLPSDLLAFADEQAHRLGTNRSRLISMALKRLRSAQQEALAAEGYRFYAAEATDFATDRPAFADQDGRSRTCPVL